ncbi:MAG: hypothetical protein UY14_C0040G0007 [Parcubacteria group bacterium GW2011_GWA1_47_9]|nr:MAG: hypothetical protein UV34_C0043G0005 [Parcubacteria group bacterium GW2011_GWB1_42_6]KKS92019.1 MAG: hypothetical protein UV67_C0012G0005 [Parcubacteria group bacterium GW2011_GWC1_43_12]KKU84893.1 MAG: hypothetical protein UY14_C0040G0007 [Parcubacteria group bacterium GW2011_GWA1_47_9]
MKKAKYKIAGMHCDACAALIQSGLRDKAGMADAKVSRESSRASVIFDEQKITELEIAELIGGIGDYSAELEREDFAGEKADSLGRAAKDSPPTKKLSADIDDSSSVKRLPTGLIVLMTGSLMLNLYFLAKTPLSSVAEQKAETGQEATESNLPSAGNNQAIPSVLPLQNFQITGEDHIRGNFSAPVTLVEFSDFQCPFCERIGPTVNKILNDYPDEVRLVYKNFPLSFHQYGQQAAEASECASEQGKFWEYHDKLFANQSDFSVENFKKWAKDLNLDSGKFNLCLDSGKYSGKVKSDFDEGTRKGVNGTPTIFVNGQAVVGAQPFEVFKRAIDGALAEKR